MINHGNKNIIYRNKLFSSFLIIVNIFFLIIIIPSNNAVATLIDNSKLYTISPHNQSTGLWSIDPKTGAAEFVTSLFMPDGNNPNFMTNALAFNPDNELFAWDTFRRQLYKIDYVTGQIHFIGLPGTDSTPRWINGLAFDKDGSLYGLHGPTDELFSIDVFSGDIASLGYIGYQINHNGLAIDFNTNTLYALTGCRANWGCESDRLYEVDKATGLALEVYPLPFLDQGQVGVEFYPLTGELFTVRNHNRLMTIEMNNGTEVEKFILEDIYTTNLAAPYPVETEAIPEPSTLLFLGSGLVIMGIILRKSNLH